MISVVRKKAAKIEDQFDRIYNAGSNGNNLEQSLKRASIATKDAYTWVRSHTKTYNQHWQLEGRPSPYEPFPNKPYFELLFRLLEIERIVWIEKSRDMMISWVCVAFLTLKAMTIPECEVILQTQKEDKAIQLVEYAKCLYQQSDQFIKDAYPVYKPGRTRSLNSSLRFRSGGRIVGIPGGASTSAVITHGVICWTKHRSSMRPENATTKHWLRRRVRSS